MVVTMLNYIWAGMILIGVVYGAFAGTMAEVTNAAFDYAKDAVSLCITMIGVMSVWMGLMEIAGKSGLIGKMTEKIGPFISFLFPNIPKEHTARGYIATNLIANILGLGWACTPAGLKAMESLSQLEKERGNPHPEIADDEMCDFLILNISSLQLIPVNMIAYRSQYGSVNPAAIIVPSILATLCSTVVAVLYIKIRHHQ